MGVKRFELVPVETLDSSELTLQKDDFQNYQIFISEYIRKVANGEDVPKFIRFQKRLQKVVRGENAKIPCGAGRTLFAIGPKGGLYPCCKFIGLKNYILGDIDTGIWFEKVKRFISGPGRSYEQRSECKKCWASRFCGGPCIAYSELLRQNHPSPAFCQIVRIESEAAIWLAKLLIEQNHRELYKFLEFSLRE